MSIQTKTMTVKSDTSLAETTTTIRDTVTFDVSNMPNGITYKGLKAVLSFADPIQWNKASTYDALTVVWDDASHGSYASKRPVPANIELTNEFYWLRTADLDAQVEIYRQEVYELKGKVEQNTTDIASLFKSIDDTVKKYPTVDELKAANIKSNSIVYVAETNSLYTISDEGIESYICIKMVNGKYANLNTECGFIKLSQLGCDSSTDDCSPYIDFALRYCNDHHLELIIDGTFKCNTPLIISYNLNRVNIIGDNAHIIYSGDNYFLTFNAVLYSTIRDIIFICNGNNSAIMFTDSTVNIDIENCEFYNFVNSIYVQTCAYLYIKRCIFNPASNFNSAITLGDASGKTIELVFIDRSIFDGSFNLQNNRYSKGNLITISHGSDIHITNTDMANIDGDITVINQLTSKGLNGLIFDKCLFTRAHHVLNVLNTGTNYNRNFTFNNCALSISKEYNIDECSFLFNLTENYTSIANLNIINLSVTTIGSAITNSYNLINTNKIITTNNGINYSIDTITNTTHPKLINKITTWRGVLDNLITKSSSITNIKGGVYGNKIKITEFTVTHTINQYETLFTIPGHNFPLQNFNVGDKTLYSEKEIIKTRTQLPENTYFCNIELDMLE